MFYLHVYVTIVHILCMKMYYYFLLNIKRGPHSCIWGPKPRGRAVEGGFLRPRGRGLQLCIAGTDRL